MRSLAEQEAERCWLSIPSGVRRQGAALLDQQMWCWGQDVMHQPNALLDYGFERLPAPATSRGSSAYHLDVEAGGWVGLWAFGVAFGDDRQGIYLGRFAFAPRFLPCGVRPTEVWLAADLPPLTVPTGESDCWNALDLLERALTWISRYEQWVTLRWGERYREQCVQKWWKRKVPAAEMATTWADLAAQCQRIPLRYPDGRRESCRVLPARPGIS